MNVIEIKVTEVPVEVHGFPSIAVFKVTVETGESTWNEICGSRDQADLFVRGVKAGAAAAKNFSVNVTEPKR